MAITASICNHVHDVQPFNAADVEARLRAAQDQCRADAINKVTVKNQSRFI